MSRKSRATHCHGSPKGQSPRETRELAAAVVVVGDQNLLVTVDAVAVKAFGSVVDDGLPIGRDRRVDVAEAVEGELLRIQAVVIGLPDLAILAAVNDRLGCLR
jgi:hypothetical protein